MLIEKRKKDKNCNNSLRLRNLKVFHNQLIIFHLKIRNHKIAQRILKIKKLLLKHLILQHLSRQKKVNKLFRH